MTEPRLMEDIEHVRHRPAMYIDSIDEVGLLVLFRGPYFYFANQILAKFCTDIEIVLHSDHSISITGSGKSNENTQIWPTQQASSIQILSETIRLSDEKSDYRIGLGYERLSVVNFLSIWFEITVQRDNLEYRFRWEHGVYVSPSPPIDLIDDDEVTVRWLPDPEIFGDAQLSAAVLEKFLRKTGPLMREATYRFHDQLHDNPSVSYTFDNGLTHLIDDLTTLYTPVGTTIRSLTTYNDANGNPTEIEFAIQFHREPGIAIISAANMHFTDGGGSHARGALAGVRSALRDLLDDDDEEDDEPEDRPKVISGPGYKAVIAVRLYRPWFEGATRSRLGNQEIQDKIADIVHEAITEHLEHDDKLKRYLQYT